MGNEFKLHHLHLLDGDKEDASIIDTGRSEDYDHIQVHESKLP
jgi:hypothetical protein